MEKTLISAAQKNEWRDHPGTQVLREDLIDLINRCQEEDRLGYSTRDERLIVTAEDTIIHNARISGMLDAYQAVLSFLTEKEVG